MLLTKIVKEKWGKSNKKWYTNKGYAFTSFNDEFLVYVEDLMNYSRVRVNVKCDCEHCKNPNIVINWIDYLKYRKEDGRYYCRQCALKLFGREKMRLTKLSKSKSFYDWCTEKNQHDILNRWDYEMNGNLSPREINYSTKNKYYFKCPIGIHRSELKCIDNFTNGHEGVMMCKACNSIAQWGIDNVCSDFLEKYWDYEKNNKLGINPWEISRFSLKKIWIECQNKKYHESYEITCAKFTLGRRCPYCASMKVHYMDSIGKVLEDKNLLYLWSDKNKKSPYEYSPHSNVKVWWRCSDNIHEDYIRTIGDSYNLSFRCPSCIRERKESMLQEKVRLYLESLNHTILHENNCTIMCQNNKYSGSRGQMPYDNEIKELKLIIEVQGEQHYKINKFHYMKSKRNKTTPEYELHMQQVRDRYKRIFAKSKGYNYLEIPHWTDNKKETWKKLINDKIEEINKKGGAIFG